MPQSIAAVRSKSASLLGDRPLSQPLGGKDGIGT
jgi:hypothetical protein